MKNTFKKGVHPASNKDLTKDLPIEKMVGVSCVHIPLSMHIGKPSVCVVQVGEIVKKGQLIARSDGFVSANVYSSISGTVIKIDELRETVMGKCSHIVIEKTQEQEDQQERLLALENPDKAQILY